MSRSLFARLARRHGGARGLDRRELLRATAAASGALFLGACKHGRRARDLRGERTVVVGAGLAGLACALELRDRGGEVIVLEARARVGGRTRTWRDFAPGRVVEAGGEFFGRNHPRWLAYAERFELQLRESVTDEDLEAPLVLGGRRLTRGESEELYREMEAAVRLIDCEAALVDGDEPWKSADAVALDALDAGSWLARRALSPLCERAMRVLFEADNGVEPERMSWLGVLAMVSGGGGESYWEDSEVYRCAEGNDALAARMATALGARVHVGRPVAAIEYDGRARVTCADGTVHEGDHVVLAAPPTVWSRIRFQPALPVALAPQMGRSVKYLARVRRPFWRDYGASPDAVGDGDVALTWESTDGQAGDDAVLCAFSSARAADACRAHRGDALHAAYTVELERLYPGFARERMETRFADWPSEPWTLAAYSFPAPGDVTRRLPKLRAGLGRLRFAGEHASSRFPGYMEGALESGERAARAIAERQPTVTASGR